MNENIGHIIEEIEYTKEQKEVLEKIVNGANFNNLTEEEYKILYSTMDTTSLKIFSHVSNDDEHSLFLLKLIDEELKNRGELD